MKPILYWTLVRSYGRYSAIGVTSEGPRGRVNGRHTDGASTHTKQSSCVGKFATENEAIAKIEGIQEIRKRYKEQRRPLEMQLSALSRMENSEIEDLVK